MRVDLGADGLWHLFPSLRKWSDWEAPVCWWHEVFKYPWCIPEISKTHLPTCEHCIVIWDRALELEGGQKKGPGRNRALSTSDY